MKDQPLTAEIKDDEIVIRVGIDVVKWALEHHSDSQPYNVEFTGGGAPGSKPNR